jgi:hypothetical protein
MFVVPIVCHGSTVLSSTWVLSPRVIMTRVLFFGIDIADRLIGLGGRRIVRLPLGATVTLLELRAGVEALVYKLGRVTSPRLLTSC